MPTSRARARACWAPRRSSGTSPSSSWTATARWWTVTRRRPSRKTWRRTSKRCCLNLFPEQPLDGVAQAAGGLARGFGSLSPDAAHALGDALDADAQDIRQTGAEAGGEAFVEA